MLDCDGVILESVEVKTKTFAALVEEHGPEARDRFIRYVLENGGVGRYDKLAWFHREVLHRPFTETEWNRLNHRFTRLCYEAVIRSPFVPGAIEFIEQWHNRLPLFVASGTPHDELVAIFEARNLTRYFKGVYGTPPAKTELLKRSIQSAGVPPARTLMVGDSYTEREAAEIVGTQFYGRGPQFAQTEWPWAEDLTRLGDFIAERNEE